MSAATCGSGPAVCIGITPYEADDGREDPDNAEDRRVVRGGSFLGDRDDARCARRYWFLPGFRDLYFGVRVVLRSAPVP